MSILTAFRATPARTARSWSRNLLVEIWLPVLLFVLWWTLSAGSESIYFPPLSTILEQFREDWLFTKVPTDLVPSLQNLALGLLIGLALGIFGGVAIGLSRTLARDLAPVIEVMRSIPVIALIPLVIVLFGTGPGTKVGIIAFGALWPTLLNAVDGAQGIDPALREVARSLRIRPRDRFFRVLLPAASPQIMAGVRVAVSIAVVSMVGSELYASTEGIGYVILNATQRFDLPQMWAALILLGLLGYALNLLVTAVEHWALGWFIAQRRLARTAN